MSFRAYTKMSSLGLTSYMPTKSPIAQRREVFPGAPCHPATMDLRTCQDQSRDPTWPLFIKFVTIGRSRLPSSPTEMQVYLRHCLSQCTEGIPEKVSNCHPEKLWHGQSWKYDLGQTNMLLHEIAPQNGQTSLYQAVQDSGCPLRRGGETCAQVVEAWYHSTCAHQIQQPYLHFGEEKWRHQACPGCQSPQCHHTHLQVLHEGHQRHQKIWEHHLHADQSHCWILATTSASVSKTIHCFHCSRIRTIPMGNHANGIARGTCQLPTAYGNCGPWPTQCDCLHWQPAAPLLHPPPAPGAIGCAPPLAYATWHLDQSAKMWVW